MDAEKIRKSVPYLIIFFVCAYFYYLASHFQFAARPGHLGPDFWPKALLALTMLVCLYEMLKTAVFAKARPAATEAEEHAGQKPSEKKYYPGLLLLGVILTLSYVSFIRHLGFILCTFLYFAIFMLVGRYRNVWAILANSVIGTLALVFIFMKVVYVSLPLGHGPFSSFSLFVMGMMGIK